jgi:radical SAM protein with 4Fe4S-binding SPASM domain
VDLILSFFTTSCYVPSVQEFTVAYGHAPRIVIWEVTRACALACRHCRAEAMPHRNPNELTTAEAFDLIDAVAEFDHPIFILTGGDPFMRDDLNEIVRYAVGRGLRTVVSPCATGRLNAAALRVLCEVGCWRISLSLDAPDAEAHDRFRGARGSFERTLDGLTAAREAGLEVQINTTVSRFNYKRIVEMADLLGTLDIVLWSVLFLVPVGRGTARYVLDKVETEATLMWLYGLSRTIPFEVKTTEAPQYRRIAGQLSRRMPPYDGIGDGKGFVFVSHVGDVYPSGFLPYRVGNVRMERLADVYRNHPFMQRLRDPDSFGGKCGVCEFRRLCGGSRARAYAMTGDAFAADPTCIYAPAAWKRQRAHA